MAIRLYPGNIHDLIEESSGSGSGVPRIVQQILGVDPYQFVFKLFVEQFWVSTPDPEPELSSIQS